MDGSHHGETPAAIELGNQIQDFSLPGDIEQMPRNRKFCCWMTQPVDDAATEVEGMRQLHRLLDGAPVLRPKNRAASPRAECVQAQRFLAP